MIFTHHQIFLSDNIKKNGRVRECGTYGSQVVNKLFWWGKVLRERD
jgi:hypothetical protein